jgi:hypothetical protein
MNQLSCPLWGISSLGMEPRQLVVHGLVGGAIGVALGVERLGSPLSGEPSSSAPTAEAP